MQRLGLATAMCALVGDDDHGRFCRDALEREGVDHGGVRVRAGRATGITVSLSYDSDRLLLTRYGTMTEFGAGDIDPALLRATRHVHCGSFFIQTGLQPDLPDLFSEARARGCTTSLDLGWDPAETWDRGALERVLPHTDVVLPNRVELLAATGCDSIETALARMHGMGAREIAVKLGAEGSVLSVDGTLCRHAGFPIVPVDTTGAGDAFNAGYIRARLADEPFDDRLALGNACGAIVALAKGGTAGLRDMAEARAFMAR
nr:carbohydrate kinase family protein [Oceaniglobus trochenteri]